MTTPSVELPRYGETMWRGILHIVLWRDGEFLCRRISWNRNHIRQIGSTETEAPYCKVCIGKLLERTK